MSAESQPVTVPSSSGKHFLRRGHGDRDRQLHRGGRAAAWTARAWIEVAVGAILTVLLLIFILQNTAKTEISFLPWSFTLPLGVALAFAAIGGILVMGLAGGARIWQLRHHTPTAKHGRTGT
ncbi:lipopolysaccharide assembly LapA domain-containing protein [Nocardia gamkensis]|uniref:lipopolysaccharide assembly LapA domain-containing protein n=1 Tax=Nocardia gamkensis TaxID=352869 RepID=UPI0037C7B575